MNLSALLKKRAGDGRPVRAGLIGAGKFGSMFLAQIPSTPGLEVTAIADLSPERAKDSCRTVGWDEDRIAAVHFLEDGAALCREDEVEVVIDATGSPLAGVRHALAAIDSGKHIVMVNVEADVLAGPALASRARKAGTVYSMAYGDQPALISEMVDWARAAGFRVQAAGKGTKYLPSYHAVTPDDVWTHYGMTPEAARAAGMNSQMFNSFLDGTKSAIEMAAVANSCALDVPAEGLAFPPCGVDDLSRVLRPRAVGGSIDGEGMVEPFHLIGLELGISVLSAALRSEPTGSALAFRGDAVAVAKRALSAGETLDGEGGYTVWGRAMPARASVAAGALPIGFAHGVRLKRAIKAGALVTKDDVEALPEGPAMELRLESERLAV